MKYTYTIIRPGGNDTALVKGLLADQKERKMINDQIMALYPTVEQVGFVNLDRNFPELMMAGGEFCGNATRSTAWESLGGQPGEVSIKVSSVKNRLRAGVDEAGSAWAQMPIIDAFENVVRVDNTTSIVRMEGITQVVTYTPLPSELSVEEIKARAFQILTQYDLTQTQPAAGVMFVKKVENRLLLRPVVWVRDIQTLFYETACGSGTTAVGLEKALTQRTNVELAVIQPSRLPITVKIQISPNAFKSAVISGPIERIK